MHNSLIELRVADCRAPRGGSSAISQQISPRGLLIAKQGETPFIYSAGRSQIRRNRPINDWEKTTSYINDTSNLKANAK